jgi:hypothetical protein
MQAISKFVNVERGPGRIFRIDSYRNCDAGLELRNVNAENHDLSSRLIGLIRYRVASYPPLLRIDEQ